MRFLTTLLLALCLASPAMAEVARQKAFPDNVIVHYSVFNSTFLQPNVAMAVGLVRDHEMAVINISPMQNGQPLPSALVRGKVRNLLGQSSELEFHRITETGAQYFVAEFPVTTRELMQFELEVRTPKQRYDLQFNQEVFPEDGK